MSVPSAIFIDTNILDEQNYNFQSTSITAFLDAIKGKELTLLLPDPTRREIARHIQERSDEVVKALEAAKRKAPFLAKWKDWPIKKTSLFLNWELKTIADKEWADFQSHFKVVSLSYDGVSLREIMDWHDKGRAPFGNGKKRKEFPDAFALAALVAFARKEDVPIAIVSRDEDFRNACGFYANLLHYPSLPAITEALIAADKRVESIKQLLQNDATALDEAVREEFTSLGFYPEEDAGGDVEDVEVDDLEFKEVRVVGIGDLQFTLAFEARIDFSAYVSYDDPDTAIVDSSEGDFIPIAVRKGTVTDWAKLSGIAKLKVKPDWSGIEDVELLKLDNSDIAVSGRPSDVEYK